MIAHFLVQGLGEGEEIGLGGEIDGHAGAGHETGQRGDVDDAAHAAFDHAGQELQRQGGGRAHVDIYNGELLIGIQNMRRTGAAESGVVDQHIRDEAFLFKGAQDVIRRILPGKIGRKNMHGDGMFSLKHAF